MKSETKTARFLLMEEEREYRGFPRVSHNKVLAHRVDRRVLKQNLKPYIPESAWEAWWNDFETAHQD